MVCGWHRRFSWATVHAPQATNHVVCASLKLSEDDFAAILAHTNSMRGLAFSGKTDGLSDEQQGVIDLVLEGKSVFVTGAAGTGKSFLLKKLREVWGGIEYCETVGVEGRAGIHLGGNQQFITVGVYSVSLELCFAPGSTTRGSKDSASAYLVD